MASETEQDEFDVAVVVFGRARGADAEDAEDVLRMAVRALLTEAGQGPPNLPHDVSVPFGITGKQLEGTVADVVGPRWTGDYLGLKVGAKAYRNHGMGAPRKANP